MPQKPALLAAAFLVGAPVAVRAMPLDSPATQIASGSQLYGEHCASCHGAALQGGVGPSIQLRHRIAALPSKSTAADLARWIRLNMPLSDPGSVSRAQSYGITAFLLARSGKLIAAPLTSANATAVAIIGGKR